MFLNTISVTFSCTVAIFLKDAAGAPDAATYCPRPADGRRKREDSDKAEKEVSVSATVQIKGLCFNTRKAPKR